MVQNHYSDVGIDFIVQLPTVWLRPWNNAAQHSRCLRTTNLAKQAWVNFSYSKTLEVTGYTSRKLWFCCSSANFRGTPPLLVKLRVSSSSRPSRTRPGSNCAEIDAGHLKTLIDYQISGNPDGFRKSNN